MKLLNYMNNGSYRIGIHTDQGILDAASAAEAARAAGVVFEDIPRDTSEAIEMGKVGEERLARLLDWASGQPTAADCYLDENSITYGPCVTRPSKIICVGLNYRKHAEETNAPIPEFPVLFSKFTNALASHDSVIPLPSASNEVDYEAELAIVIGKEASNVGVEEALSFVYGYCAADDLSARDLQLRTSQWLLGKTCDRFAPLGPYLVTAEEVGDPNLLSIRCTVNGEVRQQSNTSDMIFRCDEIVSYISRHLTLAPGDVILTGTPEGVMLGYPPERRQYLRSGDVVAVEIEKLGRLTNVMA